MTDIGKKLAQVNARIAAAAGRAGRDPAGITLVAVSKRHPTSAIRAAYQAGQRHFGENYAQELRDKAAELADLADISWHFIGHLQRNKVKYVVSSVSLLETVDTSATVDEVGRQATRAGRTVRCLVQVNVGREAQKSGCATDETGALLAGVEEHPGLELSGLMTIPPWDLQADETRRYFRALGALREAHGGADRIPELSMGMSHDFEEAIEEGATIVRVGTAIFGPRE